MSYVLAIANQKGGVGKTTTIVNLAAVLASKKKTVLVIDLDPQANATSGLGVAKEKGISLYSALIGEKNLDEIIVGTAIENINLIPSEEDLAGVEIEFARMDNVLEGLSQVVNPIRESGIFDFILIDCPPSLGVLMSNALAAADAVLIPMQCEYYALEGLNSITNLINRIHASNVNPNLRIDGILMTMYNRTKLSDDVIYKVKEFYGDLVYDTIIPRGVRASEAPSYGLPVVAYASSSVVAKQYVEFGKEFLKRQKNTEKIYNTVSSEEKPSENEGVDQESSNNEQITNN